MGSADTSQTELFSKAWLERRAPRVQVLHRLHGCLCTVDVPIEILDVSTGGFALHSPVSFPPGAVDQFQFTAGTGVTIMLSAVLVHCRASSKKDGVQYYRAGFRFADESASETKRKVAVLLDAVLSPSPL